MTTEIKAMLITMAVIAGLAFFGLLGHLFPTATMIVVFALILFVGIFCIYMAVLTFLEG